MIGKCRQTTYPCSWLMNTAKCQSIDRSIDRSIVGVFTQSNQQIYANLRRIIPLLPTPPSAISRSQTIIYGQVARITEFGINCESTRLSRSVHFFPSFGCLSYITRVNNDATKLRFNFDSHKGQNNLKSKIVWFKVHCAVCRIVAQ